MAKLRIFVSSTCYDFALLRSELRPFISQMGHDPVMSEYSDVLYDPRVHTHDSCLKEVLAIDIVVLIIGSRFGGTASPSVFADLDFSVLQDASKSAGLLEFKEKLSITQMEVLKAIEQSIPIYAFVEDKVMHDHHLYEKNKHKKDVIDQIEFPSIQKKDTARYIFEFINFLTHRVTNNSITPFSRLDEIRSHLATQWSQLLQRLLLESRTKIREERRYRDFSERIEDLKAVVLASVATPDLRHIAKGAIQFRRLIGFVSSLRNIDYRKALLSDCNWDEFLKSLGIREIINLPADPRMGRPDTFIVLNDGTFYRSRLSYRAFDDFRIDWQGFLALEGATRGAIVDALLEDRETRHFPLLNYIDKDFSEYLAEQQSRTTFRDAVEEVDLEKILSEIRLRTPDPDSGS